MTKGTPEGTAPPSEHGHPGRNSLVEIARLFLKLGIIAFGGPAAHIAMMEDEVVTRRGWISRQHFLDLVGATNLIPGPNSTEMTMHVGYERAGRRGLFTAGACFILPAVLITGAFAWLYVKYGSLPQVEPFLYGIKPAVLAVIISAVWKLGQKAVKDWLLGVIGAGVLAAALLGAGEVPALLLGGLLGMLVLRLSHRHSTTAERILPLLFFRQTPAPADTAGISAGVIATGTVSLWKLGLFFLKIGAVLYGSGYVLVAFLEGELVQEYGWLTQAQLLDAIAIGQITPGPVLSTATFIGYVIEGVPGAVVSTAGIFLPSFFFVLALNPLIPKLRKSAWMSSFLDAVNVAAIALMIDVAIELGVSVLTSWPAWVIAALAAVAAVRYRLNAVWLVVGGAVLGWLLSPWAG